MEWTFSKTKGAAIAVKKFLIKQNYFIQGFFREVLPFTYISSKIAK